MADNSRRQSMASRIATPKASTNKEGAEAESILYKAVGARIRVTCAPNNRVLEGTLFTACNIINAIAINTAPAPPNPSTSLAAQPGDWHIIPFAHITHFEVLGPGERITDSGPGFEGAVPGIARVDLDALRAREEQTIREIKKKDAQKGKGVSKETQELFDFIVMRLPARWDHNRIIVNDNVIIEPPYGLENIKAAKGNGQSLEQVRMNVLRFRDSRKQNPSRASASTPPVAPRKGG
ncbi:hypothetical protein M011DRAFT_468013 [Sporormia fimetaria CBS 119925]|uniref:AD domain-containing protein n=1 Tax=Sporormia fimetaria CBS 119925 TaxID=1340428 RepID=A0A6A6VC34_9PLEO|nr:hypothetical protein M011DRAFT_468013 [Sporormia fimetaria CBS 119925]